MSDKTDVELDWYKKGYMDGALIEGPACYSEGYDAGANEAENQIVELLKSYSDKSPWMVSEALAIISGERAEIDDDMLDHLSEAITLENRHEEQT